MRFVRDEDAEEEGEGKGWQGQAEGLGAGDMGGKGMGVGSVMVPVPVLEGRESRLKVPGLGRRSREKEEKLNDLGYRMSWSQSRTFAGRVVFLQKSCEYFLPHTARTDHEAHHALQSQHGGG